MPTGSPDGSPSAAAGCSGSDGHRDFYQAVAEAVAWDVYCPVLPTGWFLDAGTYRLSNGGRMEVSWKGTGERRLIVREGAFCTEEGGCVPEGVDAGSAFFGPLTGTLVAGEDGSWTVVVDRGAARSWMVIGTGMDESALRQFAAALLLVER
jgi:hypothetical protein